MRPHLLLTRLRRYEIYGLIRLERLRGGTRMSFFEEFGKKVLNVGETAAEKTKEVAGFAKMNVKILDVQNKLDKAYIEVGKKYLSLHPENEEEEMAGTVNAVYELEEQLKELREQLQELKEAMKNN